MKRPSKDKLYRRALIAGFFGVEFGLAFCCIAAGSMTLYAVAALVGVAIPAYFGVN